MSRLFLLQSSPYDSKKTSISVFENLYELHILARSQNLSLIDR